MSTFEDLASLKDRTASLEQELATAISSKATPPSPSPSAAEDYGTPRPNKRPKHTHSPRKPYREIALTPPFDPHRVSKSSERTPDDDDIMIIDLNPLPPKSPSKRKRASPNTSSAASTSRTSSSSTTTPSTDPIVPCPICGFELPSRDVGEHIDAGCPQVVVMRKESSSASGSGSGFGSNAKAWNTLFASGGGGAGKDKWVSFSILCVDGSN